MAAAVESAESLAGRGQCLGQSGIGRVGGTWGRRWQRLRVEIGKVRW